MKEETNKPNTAELTEERKAEAIAFYGPLFEKALDNIGEGKYDPDFTDICEGLNIKRNAPISMMLCGFLAGLDLGAQIMEFFVKEGGQNA